MAMNNPWNAIATPKSDISASRIEPEHPFDLFWGRGINGNYLFLCELSDSCLDGQELPTLEGVQALVIDSNGPKLVLELTSKEDWELFHALCVDLVNATRSLGHIDSVPSVILRRLRRWQEFLKRQGRRLLSISELMGLFGELLFLRDELIPAVGTELAISSWQGPLGYPQDFNLGKCAVELKCRSGATAPSIRISSAEQLCPELPVFYLHVYTVGKGGDPLESLSVPEITSSIRNMLSRVDYSFSEQFEDLLHAVGYVDLPEYDSSRFTVVASKSYLVDGGFPRIEIGEISSDISKVSYTISLINCAPYISRPDWKEFVSDGID